MIEIPKQPFMAYHEVVTIDNLLEKYKSANCLEWGSGASTRHFPNKHKEYIRKWESLEHDKAWFDALNLVGTPINVELVFIPLPKYITYPKGKYDFIFVDGVYRIKCIEYVVRKQLLNENGFLILHDSGRTRYKKAFSLFKFNKELLPGAGTDNNGGTDFNGISIHANKELEV